MPDRPTGSLRLPLILGGAVVVIVLGFVLVLKGRAPHPANTNSGTAVTGVSAVNVAVRQDSDADGLTDTEEVALSTDPKSADTDHDGLTDREEVKVYGTDPLKADTDGDGHSDGEEVHGGFNPKGAGPLLPTSDALRNLNAGAAPANTNAG